LGSRGHTHSRERRLAHKSNPHRHHQRHEQAAVVAEKHGQQSQQPSTLIHGWSERERECVCVCVLVVGCARGQRTLAA
jgi:adenine deaminase